MIDLTVLMPAYNEAQNLLPNASLLMDKLSELGVAFELLIVDDGSVDETPGMADSLAARDRRVRVLHHPRNLGIGRALLTGFHAAQGECTIFIPSDLAMRLDDIALYLRGAQSADVIVGLRSDRRDTSWARRLISWANIALVHTLFRMPVHQFQYICMYRTRILHEIAIDYGDSAFVQAEVLIKARDMGYRLQEVTVTYVPRIRGRASGARLRLAVRSMRDLLHFWLRWLFRRRTPDGRRDWRSTDVTLKA
jgi:glycosyltransferase involved in cell wall biosynthesis